MITNPIYHELIKLGVIHEKTVRKISDKTRDKDIPVYLDEDSGVIFLQRYERFEDYYASGKKEDREENKPIDELSDGTIIESSMLEDALRRFNQFKDLANSKSICDFGCGYGGFLRHAKAVSSRLSGVELREYCRQSLRLKEPEINVLPSLEDHPENFDLITIFHVLEHLPKQVEILSAIRSKLVPGGSIVVEVPNARDFLIQSLDLPEFRDFVFWSEHLVLHTEESLRVILQEAGFTKVNIRGFQRYGFTNHLRWFLDRQPGGHDLYKQFEDSLMEKGYRQYMEGRGTADTLIAVAQSQEVNPLS